MLFENPIPLSPKEKQKIRSRNWYLAHKELCYERKNNWRKLNPLKYKESQKKWAKKNKNKIKEWREKTRQKNIQYCKQYYKKNKNILEARRKEKILLSKVYNTKVYFFYYNLWFSEYVRTQKIKKCNEEWVKRSFREHHKAPLHHPWRSEPSFITRARLNKLWTQYEWDANF